MSDLVKPIENMTDEELLESLRQLRHRRSVERPAAKRRVEKVKAKGKTTRINKMADLFDSLSEADKEAMIKKLGG